MFAIKFSTILIAFFFMVSVTGCNQVTTKQPEKNIGLAFAKTESLIRHEPLVMDVATSYDGKSLIKFRLLVNQKISKQQAEILVNTYFEDVSAFFSNQQEDPSIVLKPYAVSFEIVDAKDKIDPLFEGYKDANSTQIIWEYETE